MHLSRLVLLYASASMKWDRQVDQGDALAEKELFATDQTKTNPSECSTLKVDKGWAARVLDTGVWHHPFGTWIPEVSHSFLKTWHFEE